MASEVCYVFLSPNQRTVLRELQVGMVRYEFVVWGASTIQCETDIIMYLIAPTFKIVSVKNL